MSQRIIDSLITLVVFFVLLFVYTKLAGPIPFSVNSVNTNQTETFNVTGEGKVSAKPNLAIVTVGVQAQGNTVKAAQDQMNAAINKVSAAIKALGVEEKDIQTSNYNISPSYDPTGQQRITGYQANTNLIIKVRNIDNINRVIDEATKNGANQVGGVSFDVDNKDKLEDGARELAVKDAKKKAEAAAKTVGFNLGQIINYSESLGGSPIPMPLAREAQDVATTQIEPGSSDIVVSVTLSYQIR